MNVAGERAVLRALARLTRGGARLTRAADGRSFGVYPDGDRRKRPLARLGAGDVAELAREGALAPAGADYVITAAGRARLSRGEALTDEAWRAQHDEIVPRPVADADGDIVYVRGLATGGAAARLARLADGGGAPFFAASEIAAANRLAIDWYAGQEGLLRGSDWQAPPRGGTPRGAGGVEVGKAAAIDARARAAAALYALTATAQTLVQAAILEEAGLEAIERRAGWPPRSAKVALKFALQQLAAHYAGAVTGPRFVKV